MRAANHGVAKPEYRMPLLIASSFLLPFSVLLLGWTAENRWPVVILLIEVGLLGFSLLIGTVPLMAYVVDTFGLYSASALTAVLVARCLMSTFLPLIVGPLTDALGYGWGFTILAATCLTTAPIPIFVMRYGQVWRQWSSYTKDSESWRIIE